MTSQIHRIKFMTIFFSKKQCSRFSKYSSLTIQINLDKQEIEISAKYVLQGTVAMETFNTINQLLLHH